jgi:hypothetical protein
VLGFCGVATHVCRSHLCVRCWCGFHAGSSECASRHASLPRYSLYSTSPPAADVPSPQISLKAPTDSQHCFKEKHARFSLGLCMFRVVIRSPVFRIASCLVWLLLYAHRQRSILGAAGHIILTPANQLMEEYNSEPPEQSCLLRWTEKIASLCFGPSGDRTPYLQIRSQSPQPIAPQARAQRYVVFRFVFLASMSATRNKTCKHEMQRVVSKRDFCLSSDIHFTKICYTTVSSLSFI